MYHTLLLLACPSNGSTVVHKKDSTDWFSSVRIISKISIAVSCQFEGFSVWLVSNSKCCCTLKIFQDSFDYCAVSFQWSLKKLWNILLRVNDVWEYGHCQIIRQTYYLFIRSFCQFNTRLFCCQRTFFNWGWHWVFPSILNHLIIPSAYVLWLMKIDPSRSIRTFRKHSSDSNLILNSISSFLKIHWSYMFSLQ